MKKLLFILAVSLFGIQTLKAQEIQTKFSISIKEEKTEDGFIMDMGDLTKVTKKEFKTNFKSMLETLDLERKYTGAKVGFKGYIMTKKYGKIEWGMSIYGDGKEIANSGLKFGKSFIKRMREELKAE